jgi:hypothetical protein
MLRKTVNGAGTLLSLCHIEIQKSFEGSGKNMDEIMKKK